MNSMDILESFSLRTILNSLQNSLGRITANHSGSGLARSWSWNSSNFHVDDVLDSSYTDEHHKPLYSLNSFSSDKVNVCNLYYYV